MISRISKISAKAGRLVHTLLVELGGGDLLGFENQSHFNFLL